MRSSTMGDFSSHSVSPVTTSCQEGGGGRGGREARQAASASAAAGSSSAAGAQLHAPGGMVLLTQSCTRSRRRGARARQAPRRPCRQRSATQRSAAQRTLRPAMATMSPVRASLMSSRELACIWGRDGAGRQGGAAGVGAITHSHSVAQTLASSPRLAPNRQARPPQCWHPKLWRAPTCTSRPMRSFLPLTAFSA